ERRARRNEAHDWCTEVAYVSDPGHHRPAFGYDSCVAIPTAPADVLDAAVLGDGPFYPGQATSLVDKEAARTREPAAADCIGLRDARFLRARERGSYGQHGNGEVQRLQHGSTSRGRSVARGWPDRQGSSDESRPPDAELRFAT